MGRSKIAILSNVFIFMSYTIAFTDSMAAQPTSLLDVPQDKMQYIADYCAPQDRCNMRKACSYLSKSLENTRVQDVAAIGRERSNEFRDDFKGRLYRHLDTVINAMVTTAAVTWLSGIALGTVAGVLKTGMLLFSSASLKSKVLAPAPILLAGPIIGYLVGYGLSFPMRFLAVYIAIRIFKDSDNTRRLRNCNYSSKQSAARHLDLRWAPSGLYPSFHDNPVLDCFECSSYEDSRFNEWTISWLAEKVILHDLPDRRT